MNKRSNTLKSPDEIKGDNSKTPSLLWFKPGDVRPPETRNTVTITKIHPRFAANLIVSTEENDTILLCITQLKQSNRMHVLWLTETKMQL